MDEPTSAQFMPQRVNLQRMLQKQQENNYRAFLLLF
jgi:hypothetical protein